MEKEKPHFKLNEKRSVVEFDLTTPIANPELLPAKMQPVMQQNTLIPLVIGKELFEAIYLVNEEGLLEEPELKVKFKGIVM